MSEPVKDTPTPEQVTEAVMQLSVSFMDKGLRPDQMAGALLGIAVAGLQLHGVPLVAILKNVKDVYLAGSRGALEH